MSGKLGEWLHPDRLEARWRDEPPAPEPAREIAPATASPSEGDPITWCARLGELARTRFAEGAAIVRILDELSRLVTLRFGGEPTDESPAELDRRIEELIGCVEDLADAALLCGSP